MNDGFHDFLFKLGFSEEEVRDRLKGRDFDYSIADNLSVKFIYTENESEIFNSHQRLWNKNTDPVFVAVSGKKSYLINVKEKPDKDRPLKKTICIQSFEYGVNTKGFENIDSELISKGSIDSAYFFDFVSKNQPRSNRTVDKDLLLNLLELKSDLIQNSNDQIIHLLILRCLFIKYLEDRGIFTHNYLLEILESGSPKKLKVAFDQVARINGDIFKYDDHFRVTEVKEEYLQKLAFFFKCDYRSGQHFLFPYQFDKIPIQLISHVYEAFLKSSTKKGDGVYYTPDFLVDFMLSQSFGEQLKQNTKAKILDPAVGSGAFLVQAFQMIQKAHGYNLSYEEKKEILKTQLFGIDIDRNALQIAAFSLYLALLEDESPDFIREKIEQENPILPSLIGETLICGNSILEDLFSDKVFDCIVSNPPWGSVPTYSEDSKTQEVYLQERKAIDNKEGNYPEYVFVADYERSQAFIARVAKWGNETTIYVMVVKNSIFLNDKTLDFRKYVLNYYQINTFYELSHYNEILFKKREIGKVHGEKVELGASEPCVVLIFKNKTDEETTLHYISPKLTEFARHFELIHYNNSDRFEMIQSRFIEHDLLWKCLLDSDIEAFELINKLSEISYSPIKICSKGFEPQRNDNQNDEPVYKELIRSDDFNRFQNNIQTERFNWNQKLRRPGNSNLFEGIRVLLANRPKPKDGYKLRAVFLKKEAVFRNDIFGIKFLNPDATLLYLGLINSSLFGFYLFNTSVQWLGGFKRDSLRKSEILKLPFVEIDPFSVQANNVSDLVNGIINSDGQNNNLIDDLDEFVFSLYDLLEYEKEIIREFYDVRVKREGKQESIVRPDDLVQYFEAFKDAYSLMLADDKILNATYHISKNMGAVICISINEKSEEKSLERDTTLDILNLVKSKQLASSDSLKVLFEEKVKIYNKEGSKFYIIKSNQFKDWTIRQAMKDAKEEIDAFIKYLPVT